MNLSKEQIQKFQALLAARFGVEHSEEKAASLGRNLIEVLDMLNRKPP